MEGDRATFAYEVVPLVAVGDGDPRDQLIDQAIAFAEQVVGGLEEPVTQPPPALLAEIDGDLNAVIWTVISDSARDEFMDLVVPETVSALDPDRVALVTPGKHPAEAGEAAWAMWIFAIDRRADDRPGLTLAGAVTDAGGRSALHPFETILQGLNQSVARALDPRSRPQVP